MNKEFNNTKERPGQHNKRHYRNVNINENFYKTLRLQKINANSEEIEYFI